MPSLKQAARSLTKPIQSVRHNFKGQGSPGFDNPRENIDPTVKTLHMDAFGEISVESNTNAINLTKDVPAQITDFDTNGSSKNTTPSRTENHIEILQDGKYMIVCAITANSSGGTGALIEFMVKKNNGASNAIVHMDRTLAVSCRS